MNLLALIRSCVLLEQRRYFVFTSDCFGTVIIILCCKIIALHSGWAWFGWSLSTLFNCFSVGNTASGTN